jgi:hypothetical protein
MSRRVRVAGPVVIAIGLVLLFELRSTPRVPVEDPLGPYGLPRVLAAGLVLSGVAMLIPARRPDPSAGLETESPDAEPNSRRRLALSPSAITVIAAACYVIALNKLGFIVATVLLGLLLLPALGAKSWRSIMAIPLVMTLVFLLVFSVALDVHLPTFLGR